MTNTEINTDGGGTLVLGEPLLVGEAEEEATFPNGRIADEKKLDVNRRRLSVRWWCHYSGRREAGRLRREGERRGACLQ